MDAQLNINPEPQSVSSSGPEKNGLSIPESQSFDDSSPFILNNDSLNLPDGITKASLGLAELKIVESEDFKLSYDGPGFPLDKYFYFADLRPDQKRSVLRSIISQESKKSNLKFQQSSEGKPQRDKLIRSRIAEKHGQRLTLVYQIMRSRKDIIIISVV